MKSRTKLLLIAALMLVTLLSGCTSKAAPPNIDAQKKVIDTYLQALKTGDKNSLLKSIDFTLAQYYVGNPDKLQSIFDAQKKAGIISKWVIHDDTIYYDELNNQTLVNVTVMYPNQVMELTFDLRRVEDDWLINGADPAEKSSDTEKSSSK